MDKNLPQFAVTALVFIARGEDLLLVRQGYGKRYWSLPGGSMEHGESVEQAAVREAKEETGLDVRLTRDNDVDKPLEERTAFANNLKANVFISIHANAYRGRGVRGAETFFLSDRATDDDARRVAAIEADSGTLLWEKATTVSPLTLAVDTLSDERPLPADFSTYLARDQRGLAVDGADRRARGLQCLGQFERRLTTVLHDDASGILLVHDL